MHVRVLPSLFLGLISLSVLLVMFPLEYLPRKLDEPRGNELRLRPRPLNKNCLWHFDEHSQQLVKHLHLQLGK